MVYALLHREATRNDQSVHAAAMAAGDEKADLMVHRDALDTALWAPIDEEELRADRALEEFLRGGG